MRGKRNNNRGFTLVELTIVIALLAIICTMIVSFTLLMSKKVGDATNGGSAAEDCVRVQEAIEKFITHFDSCDYEISVSGGKVTAQKGGTTYTVGLTSDKKNVRVEYEGGKYTDYKVNYVQKLEMGIEQVKDDEGNILRQGNKLITCTVTYKLPSNAKIKRSGTQEETTVLYFVTHSEKD